MTPTLRVAHLVPSTRAEGPHARAALWLQGCSLACPGCCNPELFDPRGGEAIDVDELATRVIATRASHANEGLTVLGGEPLEQLDALADLCERVQAAGLGAIVFTGFSLVQASERAGFERLWRAIDTLVDGPFSARELEPPPERGGRRFIGSRNQTLQHRSSRYADPSLWQGGHNSAELRIDERGRVSVHGFPHETRRLLRLLGGR